MSHNVMQCYNMMLCNVTISCDVMQCSINVYVTLPALPRTARHAHISVVLVGLLLGDTSKLFFKISVIMTLSLGPPPPPPPLSIIAKVADSHTIDSTLDLKWLKTVADIHVGH